MRQLATANRPPKDLRPHVQLLSVTLGGSEFFSAAKSRGPPDPPHAVWPARYKSLSTLADITSPQGLRAERCGSWPRQIAPPKDLRPHVQLLSVTLGGQRLFSPRLNLSAPQTPGALFGRRDTNLSSPPGTSHLTLPLCIASVRKARISLIICDIDP